MPRVTLVGYRGSGKSSVAACLAGLLNCPWQDADDAVERESGHTITGLIAAQGEGRFRDLESILLARLLAEERGVLATGGGVVLREGNRELLRSRGRPIVWLAAPAEVLRARLAADPATATRRPALAGSNPLDEVDAALATRSPLYRSVADGVVDVSIDSPARVAARVAAWLAHTAAGSDEAAPPAGETIP